MSLPPAQQDSDTARLRFVVGTMLLDLALSTLSAILAAGWVTAAIDVLLNGLYAAWTVRRRDGVLLRIALLGLTAGWVELLADWYAVSVTGTLSYPGNEPMVGRSPAYMPFAWTTVLVQLGTLCWCDGCPRGEESACARPLPSRQGPVPSAARARR